ncbi:hypothetical protein ACTQY8_01150 [Collinsella bouchesdurhonensis]|uniref:hypothetical protein n=1 Tax=Collinsella bouchesdurhonensis TaxID=1907654 RepID=UPI002A7A18C8|nr:hypothetical protein [Collinsella bouchesdurhonensis]MDY3054136.1 hypothetical protein [Collinsella bouchesdurhonensis]
MFYVTENELRGAYNREHFSSYTLPEDAKLTPSARQFLIDFHIDFNEGYGAACGNADTSVHDPAAAAARAEDALASFYDDIAVLGARLRMLGRNALGIENDIAHVCDTLGTLWQNHTDLGGLLSECEAAGEALAVPVLPPLSAAVHPLYYEMALLEAELARTQRFWAQAAGEMTAEGHASVDAWAQSVTRCRACLATCLEKVAGEARHG